MELGLLLPHEVHKVGIADGREEEEDEVEEEEDPADDGCEDVHDPEEDVGLLVDNVERQDAHGVKGLDGAGSSKLVPRAFSNLWEDLVEWVVGVGGVGAEVLEGRRTKFKELPAQEGVGEEQVANRDDKGQTLAEEEPDSVASVGAEAGPKELH